MDVRIKIQATNPKHKLGNAETEAFKIQSIDVLTLSSPDLK